MWKACVNRVTCLTVFHFSYVACAYVWAYLLAHLLRLFGV